MEMKWSPEELGGLFCDRRDQYGIYYWLDVVEEKIKWSRLKPNESMPMTYNIANGN
jgi:hypothetical protein